MTRSHTIAAACALWGALWLGAGRSAGQDAPGTDDIVLRALGDELARSVNGLGKQGEPLRRAAYRATQEWSVNASASLGALLDSTSEYSQRLNVELRVGDPKLDAATESGQLGADRASQALPLQADYALIRRAAWLATDQVYRNASRSIAEQRVQQNTRIDSSDVASWSAEPAQTRLQTVSEADLTQRAARAHEQFPALVRRLSRVLRDRTELRQSSATAGYRADVRRLVNTDGMRIRDAGELASVRIDMTAQADDGSMLGSSVVAIAHTLEGLGSAEGLEQRVAKEADALLELRTAPLVEPYVGPVLFEQEAGPQLVAMTLAFAFDGTPLPPEMARYASYGGAALADQLGQRVLPKGMQIVDDPSLSKLGEDELLGGYEIDEEGVSAQKVELVRLGTLQSLLMSRRTRKQITRSNGHARAAGVAPSNLLVSSTAGQDDRALRKALLAEARKRGLQHAYIVRRFRNDWFVLEAATRMAHFAGDRPLPALEILELKLDGTTRRVRNAIIGGLSFSRLRSALAVGRKPTVISLPSAMNAQAASIASPAWLLGEVEIRRMEPGGSKPPELPNPLIAAP